VSTSSLWEKIPDRSRRLKADLLARRSFRLESKTPFISFTFDDFPRSAYTVGGAILKRYELTGTYYISMGMMNQTTATGEIADPEMLGNVLSDGHELGCHTYAHPDAWQTRPDLFESSIIENRRALRSILPGRNFRTFAFPLGNATPQTKRIAGRYFVCCRAGKQTFNTGRIDLNNLNAYFLDRRLGASPSSIKKIIDSNGHAKGWLIFVTHDVGDDPSPYGCTPDFFEGIVRYAVNSGSVILPVIRTCESLAVAPVTGMS